MGDRYSQIRYQNTCGFWCEKNTRTRMTTSIGSKLQKNHGMDKRTKWVIEQTFRCHNKERERIWKNSKKIPKLSKNKVMSFEAWPIYRPKKQCTPRQDVHI